MGKELEGQKELDKWGDALFGDAWADKGKGWVLVDIPITILKILGFYRPPPSWPRVFRVLYNCYALIVLLSLLFHTGRFVSFFQNWDQMGSTEKWLTIVFIGWLSQILYMLYHCYFIFFDHSYCKVFGSVGEVFRLLEKTGDYGESTWSRRARATFVGTFVIAILYGTLNPVVFLLQGLDVIPMQIPRNIYFDEDLFPILYPISVLYFATVWGISLCVYATIVAQLTAVYVAVNARYSKICDPEICGSGESEETSLRLAMEEYKRLAVLTRCANDAYAGYVFFIFALALPSLVVVAYVAVVDHEASLSTTMQTGVWCVMAVYQLAMLSSPANLFCKASPALWASLSGMYTRAVVGGRATGRLSAELPAFLHVLANDPVGIRVGWLGVVRPETLLGTASVAFTYFIVLTQMAPPSSFPNPCLNSTLT